jgi:tripeptide aminopeptidase
MSTDLAIVRVLLAAVLVGFTNDATHPTNRRSRWPTAPAVRHAKGVVELFGMKRTAVYSNGGLDANMLAKHSLPTVTFDAGQNQILTVKENVHLPEFANGCRLAVALATFEG